MSVEIDGKVYLGGGIRGNGINWGYLAVDAVGGGLAAAKFLRGETLGPNDVVEVRAQFEVGDVGRVPLIGEAMKKFMPGAAEADAGAVLKMKITGDGNGGIKVASVDGFVYADIPGPAGIVGTKPGQGFLNATAGFNWTPEKGIQSANNDLLKGQIAQVFKPPEGAVKGATGWTVVGTTSNDPSAALAATSVETLPKLAPAIALAQATKFISDFTRSLDGVPGAPIVDPITHKSGPYTNTLVGVTQQIIGVPVPAVGGAFVGGFVRAQGTVTAIDDNSDAIRVKAGGNLLFQTSVTQLQGVTQNIQQSLHNLPGIGGLVPEPQQIVKTNPGTSSVSISPNAADLVGQRWVGNEQTGKQLLVADDMKNGKVVVMSPEGEVLKRYAQGTTNQQISSTMGNPESDLYGKGADLPRKTSSLEPSEQTRRSDVALALVPGTVPVVTAEGKTLQLVKDGETLVATNGVVELMRFRAGTTLAQAKELMESAALPPALKGQGTPPPTDTTAQVAMQARERMVEQPKIAIG